MNVESRLADYRSIGTHSRKGYLKWMNTCCRRPNGITGHMQAPIDSECKVTKKERCTVSHSFCHVLVFRPPPPILNKIFAIEKKKK
jgi:hypothetical protein